MAQRSVLTPLILLLLSPLVIHAATARGRYVHIDINGNGTLSLAEVQVLSAGKNVALRKKTAQTTTDHGGDSARAVDGRTDGDWAKSTITHTVNDQDNPAWEVDLGGDTDIDKIVVWNRDGFESRLNGCRVKILDSKRKVVWASSLARPGAGGTNLSVGNGAKSPLIGQTIAKLAAKKVAKGRRKGKGRKPAAPAGPPTSVGSPESLARAIKDLTITFGSRYPKGKEFMARLKELAPKVKAGQAKAEFDKLRQEALLANPLLDFDSILLVRRKGYGAGLPANWQGNSSLKKNGYDNQIARMSPIYQGEIKTIHKPENGNFVGDFDLEFDAKKMLFSGIGANGSWAVFEINVDGSGLRQVSTNKHKDLDNYDPMYLPDGRIIFDSTSGYQGVPCVSGKDFVANLHIMNPDGSGVRRLCFEQDNDWYPVMLPNGRVMYLRWEYTDSAHYFSRVLMHMNPDGTDQREYYGSNSYWPNSLFYARPVPGSSTKFAGIVTGHHGVKRIGELVLFDVSRGRHEAEGAVQRIPGYGKKVVAKTVDRLVDGSFPKFLHPYPLSEKYLLAPAQVSKSSAWGLYLVDVFDNMLLLKYDPGYALYEPVPLQKTVRPPVIPDRIQLGDKESTVLITNIYEGRALRGVPRGAVKALRVYQYEYSLRNSGGHYNMGMEGPWDAHIILGTVPVEKDGSASFKVPANIPFAMQPIDKEGKALALMRSWTVGMPGELLSCIGCHEDQNSAPPTHRTIASGRQPDRIKPWHGPARGFSFVREIQPVLDKFCIGCHDGKNEKKTKLGKSLPNFADSSGKFPKSYSALHPYVRRNGPEGDYHTLTPLEFHVDTSELVQMLQKGHHGVKLDNEAWDRLITWIDLNVPALGTWTERGIKGGFAERRRELRQLYAGIDPNPEAIPNPYQRTEKWIKPTATPSPGALPSVNGWPFNAADAKSRQGGKAGMLKVGSAPPIKLLPIPAGAFAMGSNDESPVEQPVTEVKVAKAFWMAATEVSVAQYQQFDKEHVNGVYDMHYKDQVKRGYFVNDPNFPVIRVTWHRAMAFCQWLSAKTGKKVSLPTEAQWEWACRAGTTTPLSFGDFNTDFSKHANMADRKMKELAVKGVNPQPIKNPPPDLDFEPKDDRFTDGVLHLAKVGSYQPNPWGLHDMHGNVAEWTRSAYAPYPYKDSDGRNDVAKSGKRVARGGGWHDRQPRCTSSYRLAFPDWQRVYNVGFRIVVEE